MKPINLYRALLIALMGWIGCLLLEGTPQLLVEPNLTLRVGDFKGGGWLGYRLGYGGTLMLLAAQLYLLRLGFLNRYEWLNVHCYLTIVGGSFILIHAGFPYSFTYANPFLQIYPGLGIYGLIGVQGVAAWLVLALIISGVFGRYLYRRVSHVKWARVFKWWHIIHVATSGALYVTGSVHLIIAVVLDYVSAF